MKTKERQTVKTHGQNFFRDQVLKLKKSKSQRLNAEVDQSIFQVLEDQLDH